MKRIPFLDSHTGGEPTRLVESGAPDLGAGTVTSKLARLKSEHDDFRSQVLNEPRGSDVLVGALLVSPADPTCQLGVIYFNNVGYLGMCGHGTIGLMASLSYQGRISPGTFRIETPVGVVEATLHPAEAGAPAARAKPAAEPPKKKEYKAGWAKPKPRVTATKPKPGKPKRGK